MRQFVFVVGMAGTVQNMKPVQNAQVSYFVNSLRLYTIQSKSGNSGTILKSNQASDVRKAHYAIFVRKSSILLAGISVRKISSVTRWFSPIKLRFSDYPKRLIIGALLKFKFSKKLTSSS